MAIPSSIAKITTWHDPTNASSITAGVVATDASVVDNLISDAGHVTQAVEATQPSARGTANGLNCLEFSGSPAQQMEVVGDDIAYTQPFEVWVAFQVTSNAHVATMRLFDGDVTQAIFEIMIGSTCRIWAGAALSSTADWPSDGKMHIIRALFKATPNAQCWLDGQEFIAAGNAGANGLAEHVIGADKSQAKAAYGRMGDFFIANDELSADEVNAMNTYMLRWTTSPAISPGVSSSITLPIAYSPDKSQY